MHTCIKLIAYGALMGALLTACGGGGSGDAPEAAPDVPDSALASPEGYTAWATSLPIVDESEPLGLERLAVAPTSETDEPVALD